MLLLYRNRGRLVPTTFIFSVTKHPNLWGPSGESVSWETRVFFGVEVGKGVYLQHEFPAIFWCFWTKPMIMGVRVPVYEKQIIFFGSGHFFLGGFLSGSRWLDLVMSSTCKNGPKFWSDAELASKKAVRKWWGPMGPIFLGTVLHYTSGEDLEHQVSCSKDFSTKQWDKSRPTVI